MPSPHIKWTGDDFTVNDFAYSYEHQLPAIICVSQGYCGYGEDFFTFGLDEEYFVDRINIQTRVIAKDEHGVKYSIPVSYPVRFKVLGKARCKELGRKAKYLDEILSKCEISEGHPLYISPEEGDTLKFWQGADKRSTVNFLRKLEILSTYEDKYLVVNPVHEGKLFDGLIIPYFINIKVKVANSLKQGGPQKFYNMMKALKAQLGNKNDHMHGNKEIMMFEQDAGDDYGVYASLEPSTYIACNQVKRLRKDVDVYESPRKSKYTEQEAYATLGSPGVSTKTYQEQQPNLDIPNDTYNHVRFEEPEIDETPQKFKHLLTKFAASQHGGVKPRVPTVRVMPQTVPKPILKHHSAESNTPPLPYDNRHPNSFPGAKQDTTQGIGKTEEQYAAIDTTPETKKEKKEGHYATLADVPKTVTSLSVDKVADCLRLIGLEKHAANFSDNLVDGSLVKELDADILCNDFGMSKFEALKTVKFFKSGWRPK